MSLINIAKDLINRNILLMVFLSVLPGYLFSQSHNFRNFTADDGLSQPYIYSIIQDENGYLWIGTSNGLSKYNGFAFENFTTADSLADNYITCGISDGEGLWFGHMNGRLTYYDGKKFLPVNNPLSDASHITHLMKNSNGQVWSSTYSGGLLKLDKDSGIVQHNIFKDQIVILTFDFLDNDELLIGTNSGLLHCRLKEPGEIEIIGTVAGIPESKIAGIRKITNKPGFFIATENDGVFQLTDEGNRFNVSKIVTDPDFDFTGIQDIYEDSRSDLWLCSFGNGLVRLSYSVTGGLTATEYLNIATGFSTDNVKTVFEDREGNIWSGNYGEGLTQITPKTFSVYTIDKRLYGNDIFSMWFNGQFRWIGTENGLVKMDQLTGKIVKFYGKGSGLPKDTISALYSPDGNELWIGTDKNGLYSMKTETEEIRKYPVGTGTLENSVNIITGSGKQIWVGTKKGLFSFNSATDSTKWYTINKGGLPHNYINCLYIDRTGKLWVTTRSNILAYIQAGNLFKIPLNSVTRIFTLGPVTEDTDSRIWVGSIGNGVFMIESDSITNLTVKEGLLSNYCYSIICDDNKNIWVGHKPGLSRIRTTDFSVKPLQHIENMTDNYQFNQNAIIRDKPGEIWFGSDKGIVSYNPSMEYTHSVAPVLVITSLKINDIEKDFRNRIILPPGKYKIRIDFLGVSLKEPSLVTYQYKLEGFDNWSEITKSTSATYNNLSEGIYTFLINTSSGDGAVSDNPLAIMIIIKRAIWGYWWFYILIVSILVLLIFFYIKRREYRFVTEKKILEEKVLERTYEIQCQKDEIVLQRDIIDEKNANITASIKYASNIQNAILPPIALIDRLFANNFIMSKPKDIVSGDFYWLAEKDGKIVFTVADCTGHGVPGAFMSFLGITLLNSLVNIQGITRSDIIVTKLRERVIHSLQQNRKDITTQDGMDIALCVLDQANRKIQYSGGMNNIVYIRDGKLEVIKADRFSVCVVDEETGPFTLKEIDLMEGDVFYLFSDGYKDQFGGDFDKKYLVPHFYLTLLEIHKLPMVTQKETLEKKLTEWMKDTVQTDDITIMGIQF
jgi:ligand-binding sensor domain-containing protein/serine phosphatase RsbU (regulator of sigma subunit)